METLLDKVKRVEEEVSERLGEIERQGKTQLTDLISTEEAVVEAVCEKAEAEGKEMIREQVKKAHAETNAMKQAREKSLDFIRVSAEKNRKDAVGKVVDIFRELYLS